MSNKKLSIMKTTHQEIEALALLREELLKETEIYSKGYKMYFDNENSILEFIHEKKPHLKVCFNCYAITLMYKLIVVQFNYYNDKE